MVSLRKLDSEVQRRVGRAVRLLGEAESLLLSALKRCGSGKAGTLKGEILGSLAMFHVTKGSYDEAERYFLEREALAPRSVHPKVATARFYLYVRKDFRGVISKVRSIKAPVRGRSTDAEIKEYYSALNLMGQALLELGRAREAERTLAKLLSWLEAHEPRTRFAYELAFVEGLVKLEMGFPACREYLLRADWGRYDKPTYAPRKAKLLKRINAKLRLRTIRGAMPPTSRIRPRG